MSDFEQETEELRARNRELIEEMLGDVRTTVKKRISERARSKPRVRVLKRKGRRALEPRRVSARLVGKDPVNYSDAVEIAPPRRLRGPARAARAGRHPKRGDRDFYGPSASIEAEEAAKNAAEVLCDQLDYADVKRFSPSIVGGGFWCDAPYKIKQKIADLDFFGAKKKREMEILVGEKVYPVVLLARGGFSGGWRGLCIQEEYNVGDHGVFEWLNDHQIRLHVFRHDFGGKEHPSGVTMYILSAM